MKWKTKKAEDFKVKKKWHNWFAWYPVKITDDGKTYNTWVWLETIERKCESNAYYDGVDSTWFYRIKK